jgi:sugar fermentation stimulation protein A
MKFLNPLIPGILLNRYKRFLVDMILENINEIITVYCPNPGSMKGVSANGLRGWVSRLPPSSNRKYKYRLEMVVDNRNTIIGINTNITNSLVKEFWYKGGFNFLKGYTNIYSEISYGQKSRVDFMFLDKKRKRPPCYLEVKNVHLNREENIAEFPDSVTERGRKHVRELTNFACRGFKVYILYVVQRDDCHYLKIADDLDNKYSDYFGKSYHMGLTPIIYACNLSVYDISLSEPMIFVSN